MPDGPAWRPPSFDIEQCRVQMRGWDVQFLDGVEKRWIDMNGHMNVGAYDAVFHFVGYRCFMRKVGCDGLALHQKYGNLSTMVLQTNTRYQRELVQGQPFSVRCQLLDLNDHLVHFGLAITADDANGRELYVAASNERMVICVSLAPDSRGKSPWPPPERASLQALWKEHSALPVPPWASDGGKISVRTDSARANLAKL